MFAGEGRTRLGVTKTGPDHLKTAQDLTRTGANAVPDEPLLPPIRLGCVKYLNARPLIHGWQEEVRYDHPSVLCRALAAGELDAALVSSFEYLRNPVYFVIDGLAIASDGPVFSVILIHRGPLENLREVVLDSASETSVNLLRCLLGNRGLTPAFVEEGEPSAQRGQLLIGDQAIRFREHFGESNYVLDLGADWKAQTALPFVYALWLVRPDCPEKELLAARLRSLGQKNLGNLDPIIAAQPEKERSFCEFYFRRSLRFSFTEREKNGFQKFAELCVAHKLLPTLPPRPPLV